jgi:hypothetical protein
VRHEPPPPGAETAHGVEWRRPPAVPGIGRRAERDQPVDRVRSACKSKDGSAVRHDGRQDAGSEKFLDALVVGQQQRFRQTDVRAAAQQFVAHLGPLDGDHQGRPVVVLLIGAVDICAGASSRSNISRRPVSMAT